MERSAGFPGCTFRRLWRAWGRASNLSRTTSFVNVHPIEIEANLVTVIEVDAALRGGPVGAHAGRLGRRVTLAPAVEAGGGVGALGQRKEGPDGVRRRDGGGQERRQQDRPPGAEGQVAG